MHTYLESILEKDENASPFEQAKCFPKRKMVKSKSYAI